MQDRESLGLDAMDVRRGVEAVAARLSTSPSSLAGEGNEIGSAAGSAPDAIRSSPPALVQDVAMDLDPSNGPADDTGVKSDSEAETIVLPGKDGHSPSKIRKSIKHEDKSEDEEMEDTPNGGDVGDSEVGKRKEKLAGDSLVENPPADADVATSSLGKRKRSKHGNGVNKDDLSHHGNSSGLSSVPTSPVATTRSSLSKPAASDSDSSRSPSPDSRSNSTVRTKAKSVDRVIPRRKQQASRSGDEGESRRFNRRRSSGADQRQNNENRGSSTKTANNSSRKRTRSISPLARSHRRSISTQLPSKSTQGLSHKKKRVPAPLQSTEYQSDESSASGGSHPRSSRLRHLAAPPTGFSAISPAKMGGPQGTQRKHLNSSGQTFVARACQSGKLDVVKQRLENEPEDLNKVDYAENTPLHTASIAGYDDIVQYLLEAGCIVDPVNGMRDTPLHDAIDNGHLAVVKLLLDAGANPRKANGKGEDPYDLVDDDSEVADELREAINGAKNRTADRRFSDDERTNDDTNDPRASHPQGSPRATPPTQNHDATGASRRTGTTRSIKTSEHYLYASFRLEDLRKAASENDINTVVRFLDVNSNKMDDPRSLIIAAKAGHHDVINMLFGFGGFDPDPKPLESQPPESATPILAAIGRDNLEVVKLFLNQPNFDPTRIINGETYYKIAKRRAGTVWKEEETLLKDAFDTYKKTHKSSPAKPRSPGLRRDGRETDGDGKRFARKEDPQISRSHKRKTSSPKTKDPESGKHGSSSHANQSKEAQSNTKKEAGRARREESYTSAITSDRETTPLGPPKQKAHAKRSEFDAAAGSETEAASKPRRKLISGREFRGERELEKQRRTSVASTTSSTSTKERPEADNKPEKLNRKTSPSLSRMSSKMSHAHTKDLTSDTRPVDKDKARSLKRDDSKDRLTAIRAESPSKRPRKSETPPRSGTQDSTSGYDASGGPQKRRKIDGDTRAGSKADSASSSSPDHHRTTSAKTSVSNEKTGSNVNSDVKEKDSRVQQKRVESPERSRQHRPIDEASKQTATSTLSSDKSKVPKSEGKDVVRDMAAEEAASLLLKAEQEQKFRRELEEQELKTRREEEEREAKEKAELEEKRLEDERIEAAKQARIAREEAARAEELKRQQEEEERREQKRREDAEAHIREQEKQKALYLEQENKRREDQERRRAQMLEQQRAERVRAEKEKRAEMLAKLPLLLRWLESENDTKTPQCAGMFKSFEGYRYDTIKPEATGQPNGLEQWMLNTDVALLLGEKDLQLSRCKYNRCDI